jgi:hypothetical protein
MMSSQYQGTNDGYSPRYYGKSSVTGSTSPLQAAAAAAAAEELSKMTDMQELEQGR